MGVDLNSLIKQPQANSIVLQASIDKSQPLATAPVNDVLAIQQPLEADKFDTETKKTEVKSNKILDQFLKYSGVAALILTPIAIFSSHKFKKNDFSQDSVAAQVKEIVEKTLDDIVKKLEEGKVSQDKMASQVKEVVDKNSTISEYIDRIRAVLVSADGIDIFTNKAVKTVQIK